VAKQNALEKKGIWRTNKQNEYETTRKKEDSASLFSYSMSNDTAGK
jgi:hypothetical protein